MSDYSIWVSEYAISPSYPEMYVVHGQSGTRPLPFTVTVVHGGGHTILVDTGFDLEGDGKRLSHLDGITTWIHPRDAVRRAGFAPEDIDLVIITHAHYDHMGTLADFPNATAYVQEREISKSLGSTGLSTDLAWLRIGLDPTDLAAVVERAGQGRLRLVDGILRDLVPGVSLIPEFDTHTWGHQHVEVESDSSGLWVLPGDVVYSYVNIEGMSGEPGGFVAPGEMIPIGFATGSQENCLRAMQAMMRAVNGDATHIVPGHEYRIWDRYPSRVFEDGLHLAEVTLGDGVPSRL